MVDRAMVLKLAAAAHLELAPEEVDRLAAQLTDILSQIAPLGELAGDGSGNPNVATDRAASPAESPTAPRAPRLRADVPGADPMTGSITRYAPEVKLGFFTVPKLPSHGGHS